MGAHMTRSRETYTPGYSEPTLRLMLERTAAKHAAFFTPFCVEECACWTVAAVQEPSLLIWPSWSRRGTYLESISNRANSVSLSTVRGNGKLKHPFAQRALTPCRFQTAILTQFSRMPCSNTFGNLFEHFGK